MNKSIHRKVSFPLSIHSEKLKLITSIFNYINPLPFPSKTSLLHLACNTQPLFLHKDIYHPGLCDYLPRFLSLYSYSSFSIDHQSMQWNNPNDTLKSPPTLYIIYLTIASISKEWRLSSDSHHYLSSVHILFHSRPAEGSIHTFLQPTSHSKLEALLRPNMVTVLGTNEELMALPW